METITIDRTELLNKAARLCIEADKHLQKSRGEDGRENTYSLEYHLFIEKSTIANTYIDIGNFTEWEVADAAEVLEKTEV